MTDEASQQEEIKVAWRLYTELQTRITTQALEFKDGDEQTALKSVYDFFQLARANVADHPNARRTANLVIQALNEDIRPFTARWHKLSLAGSLESADVRVVFRDELSDLRMRLQALSDSLGQIAGLDVAPALAPVSRADATGPAPITLDAPTPIAPRALIAETAATPLPFGISLSGDTVTREQLAGMNDEERTRVRRRRLRYGLGNANVPVDAVGLALSGGGIRSSTLALGVLQVLGRRGLLKEVDFLSTVSGGGYVGSFLATVMTSPLPSVGLEVGQSPFGRTADVEDPLIRRLRNHSKYLSEGGPKTLLTTAFTLLFGMLSAVMVLLPGLLILAFLTLQNVIGKLDGAPEVYFIDRVTALTWMVLGLGAILLNLAGKSGFATALQQVLEGLLGAGCLLLLACVVARAYPVIEGHEVWTLGLLAGLPCVIALVQLGARPGSLVSRLAPIGLYVCGPLFFLGALLACMSLVRVLELRPWAGIGLWAMLLAYSVWGIDINFASLHRYYRDRLTRTYLLQPSDDAPDGTPQYTLKLSASAPALGGSEDAADPRDLPAPKGPVHLINAALNLQGSQKPELRGRDSDFFLLSPHYCGSALTGWYPTPCWEALDPHLDLGTAMAISGAAAAPNSGALRNGRYRILMAMLNIRLGYWLRRPLPGKPAMTRPWYKDPISLRYFLYEILGWMREDLPCVNVSDGGHIENLGIYALLQRRCRYIIAVDGECDPEHTFGGLLTLVRYASIDLGIQIDPDLKDLRRNSAGWTNAHFIVTRFRYAEGGEGTLLYIKSSMTGNESAVLKQYRVEHPTFPHQSTAQQLFDEPQWEAYRALGEHIGEALFDRGLLGRDHVTGVAEWLSVLTSRLGR